MASVISFPRREVRIVGLISVAHFLSHFCMTALVPFYTAISSEIGASWTNLSWGIVAYVVCTGVLQTPMGFLVDRIGGRRVLIFGLTLLSIGIGSIGFVTELWQFIALLALAGVGNSVFPSGGLFDHFCFCRRRTSRQGVFLPCVRRIVGDGRRSPHYGDRHRL